MWEVFFSGKSCKISENIVQNVLPLLKAIHWVRFESDDSGPCGLLFDTPDIYCM